MHCIIVCLFVFSLCTQSEDGSSLENIFSQWYFPEDAMRFPPPETHHLLNNTSACCLPIHTSTALSCQLHSQTLKPYVFVTVSYVNDTKVDFTRPGRHSRSLEADVMRVWPRPRRTRKVTGRSARDSGGEFSQSCKQTVCLDEFIYFFLILPSSDTHGSVALLRAHLAPWPC